MKKINIFICVLLFALASNGQNLLTDKASDFEGESSGWWIQHKDVFHFSTKKASKGNQSVKFFRSPAGKEKGNMHIHGKDVFKKPLKSGNYKITAKVWLNSPAPAGFNFNFLGKNWLGVNINMKGVEKKKWVTVSKKFEVKKTLSNNVIISIVEDEKYGGYGSFYFDEIVVEKI